jgi:hypothetical protein
MSEPIACALPADALAARRADLLPGLAERALDRQPTADGYRLTFAASSETLNAIVRVIDAERQCCRWLHFTLEIPPSGDPFVLTLSAPPEGREFLEALLSSAPPPS